MGAVAQPSSGSAGAAGRLGGATFALALLPDAHVPTDGGPGRLRTLAEWNPVSAVATAVRALFGHAPVPAGAARPVADPPLRSPGLIAVLAPLAVRRYARR
ncbi:hypothetical protein [Streptomyces sp. NPDC014656]|uniref:hypothetical protein n=1 Tax=Streptomyces sp. NPDC014656 TaxID=3364878 RepID=UPI0036F5B6AA